MINFTKMHGLGNDFILIDLFTEPIKNYQKVTKAWCHRQKGIGADGLVLLLPPENKNNDLRMVIYNSDGSEADMCGNAIRCFARYAYENELVNKKEFRIETRAGIMIPEVRLENRKVTGIRVNMGKPGFSPERVPILVSGDEVINREVRIGDAYYRINALSMGNPHCVIFVEDINHFPVEKVGPVIETHEIFPAKVNVEFVKVLNEKEIQMRVWERGAGLTLACGTGACASAVACVKNNLTDSKITVRLPGGNLFIEWAQDGVVYMTGPAEYVYKGLIEWPKKIESE